MWPQYPSKFGDDLARASHVFRLASGEIVTGNNNSLIAHLPTLACLTAGGHEEDVRLAREAWALLHDASRLMDDVQDGHIDSFPDATTTLSAATALFFEASRRLAALPTAWQPDLFTQLHDVAAGQAEECMNSRPTAKEAVQIAEKKTGAFLGLGCWLGAMAAGVDEPVAGALREFGRALGVMRQIHDDLEWLEGLGAQPQRSIEPFSNLVLASAWETGDTSLREDLDRFVAHLPEADLDLSRAMRARLIRHGVRLSCASEAMTAWGRARTVLDGVPNRDAEAAGHLRHMADRALQAFRPPTPQ